MQNYLAMFALPPEFGSTNLMGLNGTTNSRWWLTPPLPSHHTGCGTLGCAPPALLRQDSQRPRSPNSLPQLSMACSCRCLVSPPSKDEQHGTWLNGSTGNHRGVTMVCWQINFVMTPSNRDCESSNGSNELDLDDLPIDSFKHTCLVCCFYVALISFPFFD